MSCADRPRIINKIKEVYSGDTRLHDIDYFEEDIADWVLSEIEQAKTEAKTEVLEEVKRWSIEPTTGGWIPLNEMNGTLLLKLEEMLSNLKKKKRETR